MRFDRNLPHCEAKGGAVEAVRTNPTSTVILRVDASKLTYPTISGQNHAD